MKHTKGEWKLSRYAETLIESNEGRVIATSGSFHDGTEETHNENIANAKLIAAAPLLLSALIKAKDILEHYGHKAYMESYDKEQIDNAINKATL